jgi:hypothetical protein
MDVRSNKHCCWVDIVQQLSPIQQLSGPMAVVESGDVHCAHLNLADLGRPRVRPLAVMHRVVRVPRRPQLLKVYERIAAVAHAVVLEGM